MYINTLNDNDDNNNFVFYFIFSILYAHNTQRKLWSGQCVACECKENAHTPHLFEIRMSEGAEQINLVQLKHQVNLCEMRPHLYYTFVQQMPPHVLTWIWLYMNRVYLLSHTQSRAHTHCCTDERIQLWRFVLSISFAKKTIGKSRAKGFSLSAIAIYIFIAESTRLPRIFNDRLSNSVRHMNTRESVEFYISEWRLQVHKEGAAYLLSYSACERSNRTQAEW